MNEFDAIWSAAINVSQQIGLEQQIREVQRTLVECGKRCGNCNFWMTTDCPKETHVNGRRRGPNMNGWACEKFQETTSNAEFKKEKEAELKELQDKLKKLIES